jgi:hypothetical protein
MASAGINTRHLMVISNSIESSLLMVTSELDRKKKLFKVFFGSNFIDDKKDEKLFS